MLALAFHISNLTIRTLLSLSEFCNVDKKARHRTETSRARHGPSFLELPNMLPKCWAFQNQHHLSIFHTIDNNKQTRIISDKYSRIPNLTLSVVWDQGTLSKAPAEFLRTLIETVLFTRITDNALAVSLLFFLGDIMLYPLSPGVKAWVT